METVVKQKTLGRYYICMSSYIDHHGITMYQVTCNEQRGAEYVQCGGLCTNDKKTANNKYYYFCRKAKIEQGL